MTGDAADGPTRQGGIGDIEGTGHSIVTDPSGPTHTGSGSQQVFHLAAPGMFNGYVEHFHAAPASASRPPTRVTIAGMGIDGLREVFVPPQNFETLRQRLHPPGTTIVLTGPPGSGRRATAKMLLAPTGEWPAAPRLLASEDLVGEERLTGDDLSEGDRLLLDVSELDPVTFADRQLELLRCVSMVHDRSARLIILVPDRHERALHDDLRDHRVAVEPPDRWLVLASHLKSTGLSIGPPSVRPTDAVAFSQLPLRDVVRVAEHLAKTYAVRDGADAASCFADALLGLADHAKEVAKLVGGLETLEERTLLLTAAMLEDCTVDAVYGAEQRLRKVLRYKADSDKHQLAEPGITDRVLAIDDRLTIFADGRVSFVAGYGPAVLTYFWDAYPNLRTIFAVWMAKLPYWPATDSQQRIGIARRFADQAARTGSLHGLYRVVEAWADIPKDEVRRLAVMVMASVLDNDRAGQSARNWIYKHACSTTLSAGLGRILIFLCTDVVAVGHLKQALIRLRWLADRDAVGAEARGAITRLCGDNRTLEQFLYVLTDRDRFDGELCQTIASPERLAFGQGQPAPILVPRIARKAVATWRRALASSPSDEWAAAVLPWLDQHARALESGDREMAAALLTAMTDLCDERPAQLARLYSANRSWLRDAFPVSVGSRRQAAAAVEAAIHRLSAIQSTTRRSNEGSP
jgi:hypothetical protein